MQRIGFPVVSRYRPWIGQPPTPGSRINVDKSLKVCRGNDREKRGQVVVIGALRRVNPPPSVPRPKQFRITTHPNPIIAGSVVRWSGGKRTFRDRGRPMQIVFLNRRATLIGRRVEGKYTQWKWREPAVPIVATKLPSAWVEGSEFHYVDGTSNEWFFLGTFVGNPVGAIPGSWWVEGNDFHYIGAAGDERFVFGPDDGLKAPSVAGSSWIESTFWAWIDESNHKRHGHADIAHIDIHGDAPGHTDSAHTDSAHVDGAHDDSHTDGTHGDVPHGDSHNDSHDDVLHGDDHLDSHGDAAHGDSHGDIAHTDEISHEDHDDITIHDDSSAHVDGPHTDSHDDTHTDTHDDTHSDNAHQDSHGDVSHADTAHTDSAHGDNHGDVAHTDSAHGDVAHGDGSGAHSDSHNDTTHDDRPVSLGP